MSLPEKVERLLASFDSEELSHSERLWPYPFDAHDVPDFGILRSYLENSDSIEDEDLVFHMENSVNCLRALEHLAEGPKFEDQEPAEDSKASFERVLELMKSIPKPENESSAEESPPFECDGAPRQFLLYKTKDKTPVLVDGKPRHSYNFDPPVILLVSDGMDSGAKVGETLFRAIPASFADEYPVNQMDVDQIKISLKDGRKVVLHLDLNFPVSNEQLDEAVGELRDSHQEKVRVGVAAVLQGIPLMPADGAGIGPSDEMAEVMELERERMFEFSQTLSDFAHFNLDQMLQQVEDGDEEPEEVGNEETEVSDPNTKGGDDGTETESLTGFDSVWEWIFTTLGDSVSSITDLIGVGALGFVSGASSMFGGKREKYTHDLGETGLFASMELHPSGISITIFSKESKNVEQAVDGIKVVSSKNEQMGVFEAGVCLIEKEKLRNSPSFQFSINEENFRFPPSD
jgi:hypothetical protein